MTYTPEQLAELDKRYIWHPFTQMQDWQQADPLIIASGDGVMLMMRLMMLMVRMALRAIMMMIW